MRCGCTGILLAVSGVLGLAQDPPPAPTFADVTREVLATLDQITTALKTVTDEDTAAAARPALNKAAQRFVELRKKAETMKPPTKEEKERLEKEFRPKLTEAQKNLFAEIGRVRQVPGGPDALKELQAVVNPKKKKEADKREGLISDLTKVMESSTGKLKQVKVSLSDALKKEKVAEVNKELDKAIAAAGKFKEDGKALLELDRKLKQAAEKEPLSKEELEELYLKYRPQVERALENLVKEQRAVEEKLTEVEAKHSGAREKILDLKKKLREAQADFEAIAKRQ